MARKAKEKEVKNDVLNEVEDLNNEISSDVKVSKKTSSKSNLASYKNKEVNKVSNRGKKDDNKKVDSSSTKTNNSKVVKSDTKSSSKASTKKVTNTTKTHKLVSKTSEEIVSPISFEYYDLPYRYNKTVIKLLAQNPHTLFVYWDVSDEDKQSYINKYGEDFFYVTKPVLVVHNLTDKHSFEIDINDFSNNWYIHVENTKCQYVVELGRKPIQHTNDINNNYLYVTSSNLIESPNDHVLFFKENDKVYFKNVYNNEYSERVVNPFLKNVCGIYKTLNITHSENSFDFNNPSS